MIAERLRVLGVPIDDPAARDLPHGASVPKVAHLRDASRHRFASTVAVVKADPMAPAVKSALTEHDYYTLGHVPRARAHRGGGAA